MNKRESFYAAIIIIVIIHRFRRWLTAQDAAEQYLAGASDLEDVERRLRALEHKAVGSHFVTFNH